MPQLLFSFATTRNPAAMVSEDRERFHVLMRRDDQAASHYWSNLRSDTFRNLVFEVGRRVSSVGTLPSLQGLRSEFDDYIRVYRDARSERRRASIAGIAGFVQDLGATPLQSAGRVRLWDCLAHYLWVNPQKETFDTIVAIMVGNKLVEELRVLSADAAALSEDDAAIVRRIADARVVLPLPVERRRRTGTAPRFSRRQRQLLEDAHDRIVGRAELVSIEQARDEISRLAVNAHVARNEDAARERSATEARVVEALSATLSASAVEAVRPALRNRLPAAIPLRQQNVAELVERDGSPTARRLFRRFAPPGRITAVETVISKMDLHLEDREAALGDTVETAHTATMLAFGAEITVEETIPIGAMIVKTWPDEAGGFHLYLSYFHNRVAPPIDVIAGVVSGNGVTETLAATLVPHDHAGFQTYRLTGAALNAAFFDVDLTVQLAQPGSAAVTLDRLRVFDAAPFFFVPQLQPVDDLGAQPLPLFGINRLGVIDYRRVEQELSCYVTGEVSRIENIMASEFKERVSRSLSVIETEQEVTQEISSEHQSDTQTAEQLEMQSEVRSVLREETGMKFDVGASVRAKLPFGELTTNASFNHNTQSSREDSTSEAIKAAKSITRKVQERIVQKTTSRRRSLSRREFEDINKHGFDNRQNPDHVVGVYRWVDKVMTNRLVNYGQLNVIEFEIPEPAKNFIRAQQDAQDKGKLNVPRPKSPKQLGLLGVQNVQPRNYRRFAAAYGIDLDPPPAARINVSRAFADGAIAVADEKTATLDPNRKVAYNEIEVPEGYVAQRARVFAEFVNLGGEVVDVEPIGQAVTAGILAVSVGNMPFTQTSGNADTQWFEIGHITGTVPVSLSCTNAGAFAVNVSIDCLLRSDVFKAWQLETYTALIAAYQQLKDKYDAAREAHLEEQKDVDLNPRFKQMHMERELKRVCIEMMTEPHQLNISANHYGAAPDDELHPLTLSPQLDQHALVVRFFEQAFWWEIMSYAFYPYFYAERGSWSTKLSMEATDNPLFASFLSAGMGRVMLPIRPGFEEAVMYYLDTGQVWFGGGFVLDAHNDLYLSIADEISRLREVDEVIEDTWQTRLPTNLTILQSAAAAMIAEGLPCQNVDARIGTGQSTLAPVLPATTPNTP